MKRDGENCPVRDDPSSLYVDWKSGMRTIIHATALLGTGYGLAWLFLTMTKPDLPSLCDVEDTEGSETPNIFDTLLPPPRPSPPFWEVNEPQTAALDAANRVYSSEEFRSPGHKVSSPLEPVFFLHQPEKFVQMFKDCEADNDCHVTYHHVPKSGGTTIEAALSKVFDVQLGSSCCNKSLLEVFRNNTEHYCDSKYTSWQMDYPMYFEIVDKCFQRDVKKKRRVLMLISYREPISMTLSFIHQRCNKHLDERAPYVQEACLKCEYESHRNLWDRFAAKITSQLKGAWHIMHLLQDTEKVYDFPVERLQVALMEPNDIDPFLKMWHPEMTFERVNEESVNICYFRMTKEYIDKLTPAAEWYRRFVSRVAG